MLSKHLKDRYRDDKKRLHFIFRWMALHGIIWSGLVPSQYYRISGNQGIDWLHPLAIQAASHLPVLHKIRFDPEQFLQALQEEEV